MKLQQHLIDLRRTAGAYRISKIKSNGIQREGESFIATVTRDGKVIATVTEWGNGGPLDVDGTDAVEIKALNAYAKKVRPDVFESVDVFVGVDLMELFELEKQIRRAAKKHTLFELDTDSGKGYRTLKFTTATGAPDHAKAMDWLTKTYGSAFTLITLE